MRNRLNESMNLWTHVSINESMNQWNNEGTQQAFLKPFLSGVYAGVILSLCFDSFTICGILGRVPLKNQVLPPHTVGFDGSSKDNWCCAWGSRGFLGDVWIWDLDWVPAGVLIFRGLDLSTLHCLAVFHSLGYFGEGAIKESSFASRHRGGCH